MKYFPFALPLLCCSLGCTEQHLRLNTALMTPTVSQIENDQVLNNLGEFRSNPFIMPSQMLLGSGGIQVSDQLNPSFKFPWSGMITHEADFSYQKQWVENWSITPVTDPDDLHRLRYLYQWAVGLAPNSRDTYKSVLTKDPMGNPNPLKPDPTHKDDLTALPVANWLWFDRMPGVHELPPNMTLTDVRCLGEHGGHTIYVLDDGFSKFVLAVLNATPNTAAAGGGGGKPKNQVFLDAQ